MASAGRVGVEIVDTEKLTKPVARFAARKKASEFCEIAQYSPGLKTVKSDICHLVQEKRICHLRYKFGFGGVDDGADDFLSSFILKLSEAFLDLIDFEVFFGSWSSATYTRRRSRIAKPKAQNQRKY